ncbi:hypothetical protein EII17_11000 [Clostridiales bacterium COT073_COT-073]|nr:hypothetical protein EII17_11000 [Clostridiales bacterium COT073_COT-073]
MKLYWKYFAIHLKSQLQYKVSFLLMILGQFLSTFSAFIGLYFMMQRFHQVEGFSYQEVLLCFAVVSLAFSLAECFARGFDTFSTMIGNGEFDRILVRPRHEIFQVLASKIEFSRIGRLLQSLFILLVVIIKTPYLWCFDKGLTILLMILGGTVVFSALFLIYAGLCFFTTDGLEFINIFTDGGREFGRYPLSIYGDSILKFFTYIVPLALFQYYPLLYLTGRSNQPLYIFFPCLSGLFLFPAYLIWKTGLKRYQSTGS